MAADIIDQDIEHIARTIFAATSGAGYPFDHSPSRDVYRRYARAALTAAAEIGLGRKPIRSELNELLLSQYDQNHHTFSHTAIAKAIHQLIDAGYAVEDPEPEWEPTEEAISDIRDAYLLARPTTPQNGYAAILKHIKKNPRLVGLGEGE